MTETDVDAAMQDEFDVMARWTQEAVLTLGPDHALPAACRGSASPAALRWLSSGLVPDTVLLDVGGGMGGPAAFAAAETGVRPIIVEPMAGACRAAAGLFGLPAVVAAGQRLPIAAGSVGAAWCVGVLCTIDDKLAVLAELRRVLVVGGQVGVLVFVRRGDVSGGPAGNTFPAEHELDELLRAARLTVTARADLAGLDEPPAGWQERIDVVEREIEARHGHDPRFAEIADQEGRISRLLGEGRIAGRLLRAVAG